MPQIGWSVTWEEEEGKSQEDYFFDDLIEWAKTLPEGFDYDPGMLMAIQESNAHPRQFISPSMLGNCPRQHALQRLVDYFAPLKNQWAMFRGTIAHTILENSWNEPEAVLEERLSVDIELEDGRTIPFKGQPDKYVPNPDGTVTLIDYKTVDELHRSPKPYWIQQVNCYAWLLWKSKGLVVSRAYIMQVGMKSPRKTEIPLWGLEKTEQYILARIERFVPVYYPKEELSLDNLPPPLDPVLDADNTWLCHNADNWCPVREFCWALRREGK